MVLNEFSYFLFLPLFTELEENAPFSCAGVTTLWRKRLETLDFFHFKC